MDKEAQIQDLVRQCRDAWELGRFGHELEVIDAHPDLAPELAANLRKARQIALAARRNASENPQGMAPTGLRIRCPHCRNPMELLGETHETTEASGQLNCDSCGESIRLADDKDATPTQLGKFRLLEQLGSGSFGTVWRAFDEQLERQVAIKIPRRSQFDEFDHDKFLREAKIAAGLHHPNIVAVHEIGKQDRTVYIVSDLVEGQTLQQWLAMRGALSSREAAALCERIANAVDFAHASGVVHRDLKPANVMMTEADEPMIMDFGLAKRDLAEVTMTVEGTVLGTPAYMSPEQAKGESGQVDQRADIYSLGVMLFEMLTTELPFRGSQRMLIEQVINDDPPSPGKLSAGVPRDLETICLTCLCKEPAGRYETAKEFADELARYLAGKPIHARPISSIDRLFRWCRRKPFVAALAGILLLLSVIGPTFAWHERGQRIRLEELNKERARMISRANAKEIESAKFASSMTQAFEETADIASADQQVAQAILARLDSTPEFESLPILITRGTVLGELGQREHAIECLQAAVSRLSDSAGDQDALVRADCLLRLSELSNNDPKRAKRFAELALEVIREYREGDLVHLAMALELRARDRLFVSTGDAEGGIAAARVLVDQPNLRYSPAVLPGHPNELYLFSEAWFGRLPGMQVPDSQNDTRLSSE